MSDNGMDLILEFFNIVHYPFAVVKARQFIP